MKKIMVICLILLFAFPLMIGCTSTPTPKGFIYTGCKGPFYGTANATSLKVGKSYAQSILWVVAWGDASVQRAAKSAGITKIHHVDYEDYLILLGIYAKYTVIVYGE